MWLSARVLSAGLVLLGTAAGLACNSPGGTDQVATGGSSTGGGSTGGAVNASGGVAGVGGTPGPVDVSCEPWHREPIPGTETVLVNNTWNEQWADGQAYSQCLRQRTVETKPQFGWVWSWPEYKPYSSYAAPEVVFGWKAWDGGESTTAALPRRIDALEALTVDFAVELTADPMHNLNTTMWVTTTDVATIEPNSDDIRNEIMVWFSNPGELGGGIDYDGEVTLGGIPFDVWHLVNHEDGSGGTTHTWTMVIYISQIDLHEAVFDLKLVLDDSVGKSLLDPTHAVGGVELVSEIFGGSGELWLERFDVQALPPP
jgi:hypothetical protein